MSSSSSAGSGEFDAKGRTTNAVVVVSALAVGWLCESFADLSTLATAFSTVLYYVCDACVWPVVGRLVTSVSVEVMNLVVSISTSVLLPDAALLLFVGPMKCLACLWLWLQACVVVDAAHEAHAFVLRRAEHAGRLLHVAHVAVSTLLLLAAARLTADLPPLGACGGGVALAARVLVAVGAVCVLCSLSERCNKGALIPGAVALYSALCCHDALLATNHNTGYLYFARCYYGPDSAAGPGADAVARLVVLKNTTSVALTAVAAACTVYAAATGSPTLVFFYDRLAASCCPTAHGGLSVNVRCLARIGRSCLERLPGAGTGAGTGTSSSSGNGNGILAMGDPEALRYRKLDTEYRFEVDEEVAARIKDTVQSMAADMCFVTTPPAVAGLPSGTSVATVSAAERSLLLPLPSAPSSSSSSSSMSSLNLAACCDTHAADARYASSALSAHYRLVLYVLLSASSAYLCCAVTDWAGYMPAEPYAEARATRWRPADSADFTVSIKLAGAFAPWVVYAAALVNSYLVYIEHNRKLAQLIHV